MKMNKTISYFLLVVAFTTAFLACQKGFETQELDLIKYNIPLKINAPKEAEINGTSIGEAVDEVTIKKDKFDVQVIGGMLTAADAKSLKAEKLTEMKADQTFKILKESETGFAYQHTLDTLAYNFFVAKVVGDKQYIFQTGFTALPTAAEAEAMFDAVK